MLTKILFIFVIFTIVNCKNICDEVLLNLEHLEELNISKTQTLIDDAFNETKNLLLLSLDEIKVSFAEIFQEGRKQIELTRKLGNINANISEPCIEKNEDQFLVLFYQVSETHLNCVSQKARKVLLPLFEITDFLTNSTDLLKKLHINQQKCATKIQQEKEECFIEILSMLEKIETADNNLSGKVQKVLDDVKVINNGFQSCSNNILKFLKGKVNKNVENVKQCFNSNS